MLSPSYTGPYDSDEWSSDFEANFGDQARAMRRQNEYYGEAEATRLRVQSFMRTEQEHALRQGSETASVREDPVLLAAGPKPAPMAEELVEASVSSTPVPTTTESDGMPAASSPTDTSSPTAAPWVLQMSHFTQHHLQKNITMYGAPLLDQDGDEAAHLYHCKPPAQTPQKRHSTFEECCLQRAQPEASLMDSKVVATYQELTSIPPYDQSAVLPALEMTEEQPMKQNPKKEHPPQENP